MGGIAISFGKSGEKELEKILNKIKHRGKKIEINKFGKVILGETSIFTDEDPSGISSAQEDVYIMLDGFVYQNDNYASSGKTKLLVNQFKDKGVKFLEELKGSFALAAVKGDKLFVARDPYGVKPLYYGKENGTLYFSSEIKGLLEVTNDINIFPQGHYYVSGEGFKKYKPFSVKRDFNFQDPYEASQKLKELFVEAIEKRTQENKRIGVLLSGGLDSSVLAAVANDVLNESLETFSVGIKDCPDLEAARAVTKFLGIRHQIMTYTVEEAMKILPEVIYHLESYDAPLVQSSIANYFVSKMASDIGCDSILCGEGADELFGGYHYVKDFDSEKDIEKELDDIFSIGHSMGFQRVDRMNSAHGLESHIPFMDENIIEFANAIPLEWKIKGDEQVEKWILRQTFSSDLPSEVVWRQKAQFSHGTGCQEVMGQMAEDTISDEEFEKEKIISDNRVIRTKEELLYYRIFKEFFPQKSVQELVVLWSDF